MPGTKEPVEFDCRPLTKDQRHELIELGQRMSDDMLTNALETQKTRVVALVRNDKTLRTASIHRGPDCIEPALIATCAHTIMQGTLDEVAEFFYLDSPAKFQAYICTVGETTMDRQNLYTLQCSAPRFYCGVSWFVFGCPWLVSNRDMCILEYHNEIKVVDDRGTPRRGWIRAMHSIELECCPSLQTKRGIVRSAICRSGHVFIETNTPGVLDVYSVLVPRPSNVAFNLMRNTNAKRQVERILTLEEYFCMVRLMSRLDKFALDGQHRFDAKHCAECQIKFLRWSKRSLCRDCHQVVCVSCGNTWHLLGHFFICHSCFRSNFDQTKSSSKLAMGPRSTETSIESDSSVCIDNCEGLRDTTLTVDMSTIKVLLSSRYLAETVVQTTTTDALSSFSGYSEASMSAPVYRKNTTRSRIYTP